MQIINYVPLETAVQEVYRLLPKDQVSYDEIYEEAYLAYEALEVRQIYEERLYPITVENYTAKIPMGLKYIEQIFYSETSSPEETTKIILYTGDAGSITTKYWQFFDESSLSIWQPLRLSSSIWSNAVVCSNSPVIGILSEHTYTVTKDRCIITSFENGIICIAGLSLPHTEVGQLMIPDERDVREALKYNILMNFFLKKDILQLQGAGRLEQKYRAYWEMHAAKCRGNMMLYSIDQLENMRTQLGRIGQHNETYNNAFSDLNNAENIKL
jgi:hypothetical protein